MTVGPIQVIAFGFDRTDQFHGEVLEELANLRGRGLIRLIDLFVALKNPAGDIVTVEMNDLAEEESAEFGRVLGKLLGVSEVDAKQVTAAAIERTLAAASESVGLDYQDLQQVIKNLQPGKAFGVLMFEHSWAIPLAAAVRRAGGVPLAQGFVTPEALVMVGEELNAIVEAAQAIEVSEIVKSAAILDILATLRDAEAIKTAIAADVLRTLAVAELIEEAAVEEAITTLAAAGLLEAKYVEAAVQAEVQEATEVEEFFSA
jgi:hypothetical protein